MVSTSPSVETGPQRGAGRSRREAVRRVLLLATAVWVGISMALVTFRIVGGLAPDTPMVHDLLTLSSGREQGSPAQAAIDNGRQLLRFAVLAGAATSAVALLLGVALALSGPGRHWTAHRLATAGMWIALAVCLAGAGPVAGQPVPALSPGTEAQRPWAAIAGPPTGLLVVGCTAGLMLARSPSLRGAHRRSTRGA